jgi:hypothetical protein
MFTVDRSEAVVTARLAGGRFVRRRVLSLGARLARGGLVRLRIPPTPAHVATTVPVPVCLMHEVAVAISAGSAGGAATTNSDISGDGGGWIPDEHSVWP